MIDPLLPKNQSGAHRVDDQRVAERRAETQAIGRSRGGRTTKIHAALTAKAAS